MISLIITHVVTNEGYFITSFIDKTTAYILVCNGIENTLLVEEILDISKKKNIWVNEWNCFEDPIPKISNGLVILDNVEPQDFKNILSKTDIQRSLSTNLWLLISNDKLLQIWQYFDQTNLKISPSARIFFVKPFPSFGYDAIQVQGTGSFHIVLKVRNTHTKINFKLANSSA